MQCNSIWLVFDLLIKSQKNQRKAHDSSTEVIASQFFSESIVLRFEFWLNLIHLCLCISSVARLCRLSQCVPQNNRPLQLRHWPAKKLPAFWEKLQNQASWNEGALESNYVAQNCEKVHKFLASSGQADLVAIICIRAHIHYIAGPMKISSCPVRVIGSYWPVVGEVSGV